MSYIHRLIEQSIQNALKRGKSILLLGPRQTGKTTLLKHQITSDLFYTFVEPKTRLQFEKTPGQLGQVINAFKHLNPDKLLPLVILDEVQKIPSILDEVQYLIDNQVAQFILTGSSAIKFGRSQKVNLLPGRLVKIQMDALSLLEMKGLPTLEDLLLYGSLPGIYQQSAHHLKAVDLQSYVTLYLDEEIRAEALVRQIGAFTRFLELAAIEAGQQVNMSKLSKEIGIGRHTIHEYYQILEDCLIADRIDALTSSSSRRRLTKAPKYLFFDLGIRRIAAHEGTQLPQKILGELFEQFIGLEILKLIRLYAPLAKLNYWRDHSGPEVDYLIVINRQYIPIEVKWSDNPNSDDCKHLEKFMAEYHCITPAYIICRIENPRLIKDNILAIGWQEFDKIIVKLLQDAFQV